MTYLLSIDPGLSTGIALGHYDAITPYERVAYWQVQGGLAGWLEWYEEHWARPDSEGPTEFDYYGGLTAGGVEVSDRELEVAAERFVLLPNGFTLKSDALEPLRIEGSLITLGLMPSDYDDPRWQRAGMQYFMAAPSDSLATKKIKARAWLKDHGYYVTGKDVGLKDADDVRSATLHAIARLRTLGHVPTLRAHFPPRAA